MPNFTQRITQNMFDIEKLKLFYKLGKNLSLSDIQILMKTARAKSFATDEYLIQEGETNREIFLIRKGLVRIFKIDHKGDEITTAIKLENQFMSNYDQILFNQRSERYYQALEATDVFYINYDVLDTIISQNPNLEANRKFFLHYLLKDFSKRIDSFVLLSPEKRYLQYVESNPDIINRVPNKYIANILGITAVSLSRIRKRIASKKK